MKIFARRRVTIASVLAATVAFAVPLGSSYAEIDDPGFKNILRRSEHVVYTETNDRANAVLAFRRDESGRLTLLPGAPFSTGGKGVIDLSFKLGPFDTDQNVVIDHDRRLLFAVNSSSNSIAVFHIRPHDGSLEPTEGSPFPSGGINPVSIGLRGDQIVIINQDRIRRRTSPEGCRASSPGTSQRTVVSWNFPLISRALFQSGALPRKH